VVEKVKGEGTREYPSGQIIKEAVTRKNSAWKEWFKERAEEKKRT
jgi:hypothetical protein